MASALARDELQSLSAAAVAATPMTHKKKSITKDWLLKRGSMSHLQLLEELKE